MANKYYDGSEKDASGKKKSPTGKSVGKKIVDGLGSVAGLALIILGASKGIKNFNNKA